MRSILFFDLPTITLKDKRNYRIFIKGLKKMGFYMIQESVYVKMSIDQQAVDSIMKKVRYICPSKGSVMVLNITEKQFSNIKVIVGDLSSDVISSDSRMVIL